MRLYLGFKVRGDLKWISHIEYIRLFERMFRRVGFAINYSRGFNPHPKIKLPVPKSIGIESDAEFVEVECEHDEDELEARLKDFKKLMEKNGIDVFTHTIIREGEKALSKRIGFIKYCFYGTIDVPENTHGLKGIIDYKTKENILEMKVERNFSFSKFSKEIDFDEVCREIILR